MNKNMYALAILLTINNGIVAMQEEKPTDSLSQTASSGPSVNISINAPNQATLPDDNQRELHHGAEVTIPLRVRVCLYTTACALIILGIVALVTPIH